MSKEKLHSIITESFVNDKIDVDRFLKMSEKVDKISDERAEQILTEFIDPISAIILGGAMAGWVVAGGYVGGKIGEKIDLSLLTGLRSCKKKTAHIKDDLKRKRAYYKCRIEFSKALISKTNAIKISFCKKQKNPEKCIKKTNKQLEYIKSIIVKFEKKLRELK